MSIEQDKQLSRIVCICKGINLRRVLKGLMESFTIQEVNEKTGTGSGGCGGRRCGPRIRILLDKKGPVGHLGQGGGEETAQLVPPRNPSNMAKSQEPY